MKERFIGEAIAPVAATFDTRRMAAGEPGLPGEFTWRGETLRVAAVRRAWRDTGPCDHGSGELYLRKHWYEVEDDAGRVLKLYFERNPRDRKTRARWRLFSMEAHDEGNA